MIKLIAVGDIMLGERPHRIGNGIDSFLKKQGYDNAFQNVSEYFLSSDFTIGNLEAILTRKETDNTVQKARFKGSPNAIDSLKAVNFNLLNIANNHILEHGPIEFINNNKLLKKYGINIIGSLQEANIFYKKEIDNIGFCFLGLSLVKDKFFQDGYYYQPKDENEVINLVKSLKNENDHIIISIHWGQEHVLMPSSLQIKLAHDLIDNGASLILGHHSHCYQGTEKYKNGIVIYSLGNFVFDMEDKIHRESLLAEFFFDKNNIVRHELYPILISKNGLPHKPNKKLYDQLLRKYDNINSKLKLYKQFSKNEYDDHYQKEYKKSYKRFKLNVKINFLKNILFVNPKVTFDNIIDYFKK